MRAHSIIDSLYKINDGTRSLLESVVVPEVAQAMKDWITNTDPNYVIIGGTALGFYSKPRATMDVDVLFMLKSDIPETVAGFKRTRPGAFQHNNTHVEVEVLTSDTINIPLNICKQVIATAINHNGVNVASPSGLVALKLIANRKGKTGLQDRADIASMIELGGINLSSYSLPDESLQVYNEIKSIVEDSDHE